MGQGEKLRNRALERWLLLVHTLPMPWATKPSYRLVLTFFNSVKVYSATSVFHSVVHLCSFESLAFEFRILAFGILQVHYTVFRCEFLSYLKWVMLLRGTMSFISPGKLLVMTLKLLVYILFISTDL